MRRLTLLALAACALAAVARGQAEPGPAHAPLLEPFCLWSKILFVPFVPETDFYLVNHTVANSCDDKLTLQQKQRCERCARRTTRAACLSTVADTWFEDADQESCTWVDFNENRERTLELNFTLGVNNPFMFSSTANKGKQRVVTNNMLCSVTREFEVLSPEYTMAYFSAFGNGEVDELGPRDGDPLPGGQQPDASCVVKRPNTKCQFTLHYTPNVQWAVSSVEIWTQNQTIIKQLKASEDECLADKSLRCTPADPPFRYRVKLTEHKCVPNTPIPSIIKSGGVFPMAQPGYVLYPGGFAKNYRQTGFEMEGISRAKWSMKSQSKLMVMVAPAALALNVCPPGKARVCDYRKVWDAAYPKTKCHSTVCEGVFSKPPERHDILMIVYPRFNNEEEPAVDWQVTPPQLVAVNFTAWP